MLRQKYPYETTLRIRGGAVVGEIFLRHRAPGDVILSGGMHKTVRRLSCLSHLPPEVRARMPLILDEQGILAVPFGPVRDGAAQSPDLDLHVYFS